MSNYSVVIRAPGGLAGYRDHLFGVSRKWRMCLPLVAIRPPYFDALFCSEVSRDADCVRRAYAQIRQYVTLFPFQKELSQQLIYLRRPTCDPRT